VFGRKLWLLAGGLTIVAAIVGLCLTRGSAASIRPFESPLTYNVAVQPFVSPLAAQASETNLLVNGDMDGAGGLYPFYWRPTNHFVAGMWYEWFWTGAIPEFIDGGHPYHNVCYPPPTNPLNSCELDDNHSQGYIVWGGNYAAGIYQPVSVTPCAYYRFDIYNADQDPNYYTRVGIDPTGQGLPPHDERDRADYPKNCPPDYHSECPNPGLDSLAELPPHIVWSPEYNIPGWHPETVSAEAVSTTITVWTYAAPQVEIAAKSTYWDYAFLAEASFPDNRFPPPVSAIPSGFVTNVFTSTVLDFLVIEWDTPEPASTQVWYRFITATMPITHTGAFTIYIPLVIRQTLSDYPFATIVDTTPITHHRTVIHDLNEGDQIEFIALSRRPVTTTCTTEMAGPLQATMGSIPPIVRVYLPLVMRGQ
jgi:hypothetical protein